MFANTMELNLNEMAAIAGAKDLPADPSECSRQSKKITRTRSSSLRMSLLPAPESEMRFCWLSSSSSVKNKPESH